MDIYSRLVYRHERNRVIHGDSTQLRSLVIDWATTYLYRYQESQSKTSYGSPSQSVHRWVKPSVGRYKLNVDTALDSSTNSVGIGAIYSGTLMG
ncbi:hypothetical protein TorRG33x02_344150 [Trema orientale]|uniref:Uncharacterized protein n=1 Tax=Trema orientale TaxID=63057 RepID=A0A2P5AQL5_TREOI|nr:hypothetical protein TorRG33x02_344150 [Trema orientale]